MKRNLNFKTLVPRKRQTRKKLDLFRICRNMAKNNNNPYGIWDSGLNPRYLLWEIYKQPISQIADERPYSHRAFQHLLKHGQIIDEFIEIEDIQDDNEKEEIIKSLFSASGSHNKRFLYKDNIITATLRDDNVYSLDFCFPVSKKAAHTDFQKWIMERKGESKVSVLITRNGNLTTSKVSFNPPVIQDMELNYGTGFSKKYQSLVEKLNQRKSGIILMHGTPGSGKSTMLKHLSSVIDREWIFIPPNLADRLASPDFISLLMGKKEAVLILEDAEQAVNSREKSYDTGSISTLLNLSDGILGNMLSITCVISFNFNKDGIDPALLRPGRLLMDLDFPALSIEDAQRLSDKLGFQNKIDKPMTLAEIYNQKEDNNYTPAVDTPTREIGFHTLIASEATPKPNDSKEKVEKS